MAISSNLAVIAAICGNFYQESTVNPGVWERLTPNNPGYGLGQWTDNPPQVMRRTALFNWLDNNGFSRDSGEGQLQFLVYENLWIPSLIQPSAYNTLTDYFNSTSTNISDLVYEFMYHWEGINDASFNTRYQWAQTFYGLFVNDVGTRQPWTSGNFYCTPQQTLDNALLVKDFFLEEEPTPPEPPEPTTDDIVAIAHKLIAKKKIKGVHIIV